MEAVQHYFRTIERGNQQLVIDLPDGVNKVEIEVIVRPLIDKSESVRSDNKPERYYVAQQMKGTMSSDYESNQYDVYDQ